MVNAAAQIIGVKSYFSACNVNVLIAMTDKF